MMYGALGSLVMAVVLLTGTGSALAQEAQGSAEHEKKLYKGPDKVSFGGFDLVLGEGAVAEVQYMPDAKRLWVKTVSSEARVVASARSLILFENIEGTMRIRLPNGRIIAVEPGRSEIVGRAVVDDPGAIVVTLASTGTGTVLDDETFAALGVETVPSSAVGPNRGETSFAVSPSRFLRFGTIVPAP